MGRVLVNVTLLFLTVWNLGSFILVHPKPAKPILFYFKFSPQQFQHAVSTPFIFYRRLLNGQLLPAPLRTSSSSPSA